MAIVIALCLVVHPQLAFGEKAAESEFVRGWSASSTILDEPGRMDHSVDGTVAIVGGQSDLGGDADPSCVVAVFDEQTAVSYDIQREFRTTRCIDAVAHPEGGFFLRAAYGDPPDDRPPGFTAFVDVDGDMAWVIDDEELLDRRPRPDGPGEFLGDYDEPTAGLAYDPDHDLVLGLTAGRQVLPDDEHRVVQVHAVDATTGELLMTGQTFGSRDFDDIADLVARDGEFLVHTVDDEDRSRFYSFQWEPSITEFEPEEVDWTSRRIAAPIRYRPSVGTVYLWQIDEPGGTGTVGATRVEGLDSPVWTAEYETVENVGSHSAVLDDPTGLWLGDSMLAITYRTDDDRQFGRFVDLDTGETLAITDLAQLTDAEPLGFVPDADGELLFISAFFLDQQVEILGYELSFRTVEDVDPEPDGDNGEDNGCRHTTGPLPVWPPIVAAALLIAYATFRRAIAKSTGRI